VPALSVVRPVAAPLSLARKANRPDTASSGTTNASTRIAICDVAVTGTQDSSSAVSSTVPTVNAKNPSGRLLAIGCSITRNSASGSAAR
jgi:hypothetical protein